MGHLISPKEKPDWGLTSEEFSKLFNRDWVVVDERLSPSKIEGKGYWKIQIGVYTAQCWVYGDGVALHTDADLVRTLLLAFWYRQFVPQEIALTLYSDGNEIMQITKPFDELCAFHNLFCESK